MERRQHARDGRPDPAAGDGATATSDGAGKETSLLDRMFSVTDLEGRTNEDLQELAREFEIVGAARMRKQDLIFRIIQAATEQQGNIFGAGILEILEEGFGFLRQERFLPGPDDIYVSQSQIRRFGLRTGDYVIGGVRPPKESERYYSLLRVDTVNGVEPEIAKQRPYFDTLTAVFPD